MIIFIVFIAAGFFYWLLQFILTLRIIKSIPRLENLKDDRTNDLSKVSVIITACNEAEKIKDAIETRLNDDYPNLEIILVDDRSTDSTANIIDNITKHDTRVKAVHIRELPEGWLGKINAMNQGIKLATGDWFLFSDADVHIAKGAIARTIAYAEKNSIDHVAVVPELRASNFFIQIVASVFLRLISIMGRIWAIENPKSSAAAGSGSFNLIRRKAFERTKGFEWIKLEPADDVALGIMLKKSGARSVIINGCKFIGVHMYTSFSDLARAFERASFTSMGNFSLFRIILFCLIWMTLELAPFLAFIPGIIRISYAMGLIAIVLSFVVSLLINLWFRHPLLPTVLWPIGMLLHVMLFIRAGILGVKRGGIFWRGTFYSAEMLKKGRRYSFR